MRRKNHPGRPRLEAIEFNYLPSGQPPFRSFLKGIFSGIPPVGRRMEEAFIKSGFYIDTPYNFARICKQLTLLVFQCVTPLPAGQNLRNFT
jgi:hypothetical protein